MKILVVGLGSMGKRRVRNLQSLGERDVAGFDMRADRREEAARLYGIRTFESYEAAVATMAPEALVVSTPPDLHVVYAHRALAEGRHCFLEASVAPSAELRDLHQRVAGTSLVIAPSCTMRYFPAPRRVAALVAEGAIGRVLSLSYHLGQYLPDWHPWEDIRDFYVSRRETGACREIIPFELTWLNHVFGEPRPLAAVRRKLSDLPADIDDAYHMIFEYPGPALASITIEVLSRPRATRELRVVGTEGLLVLRGEERVVRHLRVGMDAWEETSVAPGTVEAQYINPEEPYREEMRDFVAAAAHRDRLRFPNTLEDDAHVLSLLEQVEQLAERTR